ncbi:MAG: thioredoxin-disulfide reductase [Deltaproteobacteria bacterium]|nr:thioredoxin-disulfide reductase [Deltaproteobacteria bacterium]
MSVRNIIIIGSGPAGYTAAIYTARANLNPLLFEGYLSGGQLMNTTEVENFPGYPKGITGPEMMMQFKEQAARFNTEFLAQNCDAVDFTKRPFKIMAAQKEYLAKAVIIATGATAQYLGLPSEQRLIGKGVSGCATCDGAFFKGEKVAVIGGGDSAIEEALFLTRFASEVVLIHRRDALRASKIMQDRVLNHAKIKVYWNTVVTECMGDTRLEKLKLKNTKTNQEQQEPFGGMFLGIGHTPTTEIFKGHLELDHKGYIVTKGKTTHTSVAGVFACGDVQDSVYRQAVTAAGSGCAAAIDAERWLEGQ